MRTYKQAYSFNINPIVGKENWSEHEGIHNIMPLTMKRGVGRPSRNRRREEGEDQKGKRSKTVKCTKCGHFGHNARTCKGGPTGKEMKAIESNASLLVRHPRVRDQSNAAKAARAANKVAKDAAKTAAEGTSSRTSTRKRKAGNLGSASQPSILTASQSQHQK